VANYLVLTKVDADLALSAEQSTAQGPCRAANLHPSGVAAGHEPLTRNGSSEPITRVWVEARGKAGKVIFSKSDKPIQRPRQDTDRVHAYEVIAPNTIATRRFEVAKRPIPYEVEIVFTDSAGHRWKRHPNGRLELLLAPQSAREPSVKDRLDAFTKGQMDQLDT
jgi:hypothetical protein